VLAVTLGAPNISGATYVGQKGSVASVETNDPDGLTWRSLSPTVCRIDATGNVTYVGLGTCRLEAKVNATRGFRGAKVAHTSVPVTLPGLQLLGRCTFLNGVYALNKSCNAVVRHVSSNLKKYNLTRVLVAAHADKPGDSIRNVWISKQRALYFMHALSVVTHGAPPPTTLQWYGAATVAKRVILVYGYTLPD
jgi:outer membrane protein OmpA-like peptidoglycan-associated protein